MLLKFAPVCHAGTEGVQRTIVSASSFLRQGFKSNTLEQFQGDDDINGVFK
jgi:hypothetical protein